MKHKLLFLNSIILFVALQLFVTPFNCFSQVKDITLTIHLRGVYESKISLLSMAGSKIYRPIIEKPGIKNGETTTLKVLKEYLPGEFVIRFDYMEKESSTPYPSEKSVFMYEQDLELWVSPIYCNNADSTWFQKGELENSTYVRFSKENGKQKEKLGLLQNFLMNYDDTESTVYQEGIKAYEQRRQDYNKWLKTKAQQDKKLFVSNMYGFQYVPEISLKGSETDRINSLISHYFDGLDFKDPLLIKTSNLNKWMDNYVNLYGQLSTTTALRDSLFPLAGKTAIEKAKKGDPLVYGWMVDYFYRGYESNGIDAGMKILEPYLSDPNCLTTKRQEIERRLKGMETLVPGSQAPEISMKDPAGNLFELSRYEPAGKYILILFWSAGCSHCVETVEQLYPWQSQPDVQKTMQVLAVSLDETDADVKAWKEKTTKLEGWKHLHDAEGVRSKVAADYYVLATPIMVVIDAKTKKIVASPNTVDELRKAIQKK